MATGSSSFCFLSTQIDSLFDRKLASHKCRILYLEWGQQHPSSQFVSDYVHEVTLFQSSLVTDSCMKIFVAESLCAAVLDSGATATVSGRRWMETYVESLPDIYKNRVEKYPSGNSFKFGSGAVYTASQRMKVPACVGEREIFIVSDVIEADIPMLLSKASMKKANTKIDFQNDQVSMLGEVQDIIVTSSGHYALPLNKNFNVFLLQSSVFCNHQSI